MPTLDHLIDLGDPDELTREIDRLCERRDWDGLLELRRKCRAAVDTGRQLWGAAAHGEYRLALEAPGPVAASVVDAVPAPAALGPLAEVAASTHRWADMRPGLPEGPTAGLLAYECVARGEDLSADPVALEHRATFGLPLVRQSWEPEYPQAVYRGDEAEFERPTSGVIESADVDAASSFESLFEPDFAAAVADLLAAWVQQSNGRLQSAVVSGGLHEAVGALDLRTLRLDRVNAADALAAMAWAGAHGGFHGRRAGMASGRSKSWAVLSAMAGVSDEWPPPPSELGDAANELQWWTWGGGDPSAVELRLLVVDPVDDVTFAIDAWDESSYRLSQGGPAY